MEDLQKLIQKSVQEATNKSIKEIIEEINNNSNKPIFEFVATYDAGSFARYINY